MYASLGLNELKYDDDDFGCIYHCEFQKDVGPVKNYVGFYVRNFPTGQPWQHTTMVYNICFHIVSMKCNAFYCQHEDILTWKHFPQF